MRNPPDPWDDPSDFAESEPIPTFSIVNLTDGDIQSILVALWEMAGKEQDELTPRRIRRLFNKISRQHLDQLGSRR